MENKIRAGTDASGVLYVITAFPEAMTYLKQKLSELGSVDMEINQYIPQNAVARIVFNDFPTVRDWRKGGLDGGLFINSAAGGCFLRPSIVNCRLLPKANSKVAQFLFSLDIDTRDGFMPEQHSVDVVKSAIDDFVERCKVGFCYHFSN